MESPLHHFEIHTVIPIEIGGLDLSINNAVIAMLVGLVLIGSVFIFPAKRGMALIPDKIQSILEIAVEFIRDLVYEFIGEEEGRNIFPLLQACSYLYLLVI